MHILNKSSVGLIANIIFENEISKFYIAFYVHLT